MNILERIVADKRVEVNFKKSILPLNYLRKSPMIQRDSHSLKDSLRVRSGIIAEFKRRSPSKQVINQTNSVVEVAKGYQEAGASGMSVLTDTKYFGGALDDLLQVRSAVQIPVLRKDFMIDPYQLFEAKAFGADVILLIAAVLKPEQVTALSGLAHDLGMEVLLEVHNEEELMRSDLTHVDLVGVNNRNLKTFEVSIAHAITLFPKRTTTWSSPPGRICPFSVPNTAWAELKSTIVPKLVTEWGSPSTTRLKRRSSSFTPLIRFRALSTFLSVKSAISLP